MAGDLEIAGTDVDAEGRCRHWRGPLDVVAIRLPCCDPFWSCHRCHEDSVGHPVERWPRARFDEAAVLCGSCRSPTSIARYLESDRCPACGHGFNPSCATHWPFYFEL